jgi:hypothetical protein
MIENLNQFSIFIGRKTFTQKEYRGWNKALLCPRQITVKFGSWNEADLLPRLVRHGHRVCG